MTATHQVKRVNAMKRYMGLTRTIGAALLLAVSLAGAIPTDAAVAQSPRARVTLTAPITGINVESAGARPAGYNLDITIGNPGDEPVSAHVRLVSGPDGWKAGLLQRVKEVFVKKLELAPGAEDDSLKFHFEVPTDVENGTFVFRVGLFDDRDQLLNAVDYKVVVDIPPAPEVQAVISAGRTLPEDVLLDPQYFHLTGRVGTFFIFRFNLKNRTSQEREFVLSAGAPPGWSVTFRPSFQAQQIGAITLRPNANQDIDARVTPPGNALPGPYSIVLGAAAEDVEPAQATVQAELVGSPRLALGTIDESNEAKATAGESSAVKFLLVNSGTGPAKNVELAAEAPQGWEVRFNQNPVPEIQPNQALEVTATIIPADDTDAGDYNVDITSSVPESSAEFRFRITLERSSTFGFLGIAVIVLLVGGLGALFVRLVRR